jgi:hypothetical protein
LFRISGMETANLAEDFIRSVSVIPFEYQDTSFVFWRYSVIPNFGHGIWLTRLRFLLGGFPLLFDVNIGMAPGTGHGQFFPPPVHFVLRICLTWRLVTSALHAVLRTDYTLRCPNWEVSYRHFVLYFLHLFYLTRRWYHDSYLNKTVLQIIKLFVR